MSYEIFFKRAFAEFLRENFRTAAHIAVCFDCTERTAQNWLDEAVAPRGHIVAKALTDPQLAPSAYRLLGGSDR